ncbi:unnamed protein product, partial [Dibothriocephalus latus]
MQLAGVVICGLVSDRTTLEAICVDEFWATLPGPCAVAYTAEMAQHFAAALALVRGGTYHLNVDCAHGVGGIAVTSLAANIHLELIKPTYPADSPRVCLHTFNTLTHDKHLLNNKCGADFVKWVVFTVALVSPQLGLTSEGTDEMTMLRPLIIYLRDILLAETYNFTCIRAMLVFDFSEEKRLVETITYGVQRMNFTAFLNFLLAPVELNLGVGFAQKSDSVIPALKKKIVYICCQGAKSASCWLTDQSSWTFESYDLQRVGAVRASSIIIATCVALSSTAFLSCSELYGFRPQLTPSEDNSLAFTGPTNERWASIDGDADRLIYFYPDPVPGCAERVELIDGDRIAVLFASFIIRELKRHTPMPNLRLGVVQTAYSNAAATTHLRRDLDVEVAYAKTGVKYLHKTAKTFDFGIYFESNGHGTVLLSAAAEKFLAGLPSDSLLRAFFNLVNSAVGDALSDLLLVEFVLATG